MSVPNQSRACQSGTLWERMCPCPAGAPHKCVSSTISQTLHTYEYVYTIPPSQWLSMSTYMRTLLCHKQGPAWRGLRISMQASTLLPLTQFIPSHPYTQHTIAWHHTLHNDGMRMFSCSVTMQNGPRGLGLTPCSHSLRASMRQQAGPASAPGPASRSTSYNTSGCSAWRHNRWSVPGKCSVH